MSIILFLITGITVETVIDAIYASIMHRWKRTHYKRNFGGGWKL